MKSQPNSGLVTHRGLAKMQTEGTELNGLIITHFRHFNFQSLSSPVTLHIYAHTMSLPLLQKYPYGTAWADVPPSSYLGTVYKSDHLGSVSSFEKFAVTDTTLETLVPACKTLLAITLQSSVGASEVYLLLHLLLLTRVSIVTLSCFPVVLSSPAPWNAEYIQLHRLHSA